MNKTMIGKDVVINGYGKFEGRTRKVQVVGADATTVTLRFQSTRDPNKPPVDTKFKRSDGSLVNGNSEQGYAIPKDVLKTLFPEERATGAGRKSDGQKGSETGEKTVKETRKKEPRLIPPTDWCPERLRHYGKVPDAKSGQIRVRVASRGYFSVHGHPLFNHTKGESDAKKSFVDAWRNPVDKRWIYVYMDRAQSEYCYNEVLPKILAEMEAPSAKTGGYKRTFRRIASDLKAKWGFKDLPVVEKKADAKKEEPVEPKRGRKKPVEPDPVEVDEVEEEEVEETEDPETVGDIEGTSDTTDEVEEVDEIEEEEKEVVPPPTTKPRKPRKPKADQA